jgi:hypothetical protein
MLWWRPALIILIIVIAAGGLPADGVAGDAPGEPFVYASKHRRVLPSS